jgi:hypothetical protein
MIRKKDSRELYRPLCMASTLWVSFCVSWCTEFARWNPSALPASDDTMAAYRP